MGVSPPPEQADALPATGAVWVYCTGDPGEDAATLNAARRLSTAWTAPLMRMPAAQAASEPDGPGRLAASVAPLLAELAARAVVLPVSANSLGAALAGRLGVPICPGGRDVTTQAAGVIVTRPLYKGRIDMRLRVPASPGLPLVLTVFPETAARPPASAQVPDGTVATLLAALPEMPGARVIRRFRVDPRELDLTEADIIVAGGRGVGGPRHWHLLEMLADALDAAVAGSRVAMDNGWIPRARMVGQSGRSVAPQLYLAVGISGAPQHLGGIRDARLVVAINKDKHAPIFRVADVGIVADLHEVVPLLIQKLSVGRPRPHQPATAGGTYP